MNSKINKIISLYGAAGLVFLSVLIRDYYIKISYVYDYSVIYESFYISSIITMVPANIILFAKITKKRIRVLSLMLCGVVGLAIAVIGSKILMYSIIFSALTLISSFIGNLIFITGNLFAFRARDFFLYSSMIFLMFFIGGDWVFILGIMQLILMFIVIYLSAANSEILESSNINTLSISKAFVVAIPSLVFQFSLFCFSYFKIFEDYEYFMRVSIYINSLLLVAVPVFATISRESAQELLGFFEKTVLIIFFSIACLFYFDLIHLFFIFFSILFSAITYVSVLRGFLSSNSNFAK